MCQCTLSGGVKDASKAACRTPPVPAWSDQPVTACHCTVTAIINASCSRCACSSCAWRRSTGAIVHDALQDQTGWSTRRDISPPSGCGCNSCSSCSGCSQLRCQPRHPPTNAPDLTQASPVWCQTRLRCLYNGLESARGKRGHMAKRVVLPMLALSVRPASQASLASYKVAVIRADPALHQVLLAGASAAADSVVPAEGCSVFPDGHGSRSCNATQPLISCCPAPAPSVGALASRQLCVAGGEYISSMSRCLSSFFPVPACCASPIYAEAPAAGVLPASSCQLLAQGFGADSCNNSVYPSSYCCSRGLPYQNPAGAVAGVTCTPSSVDPEGAVTCPDSQYTNPACCHGGLAPSSAPGSAQAPFME